MSFAVKLEMAWGRVWEEFRIMVSQNSDESMEASYQIHPNPRGFEDIPNLSRHQSFFSIQLNPSKKKRSEVHLQFKSIHNSISSTRLNKKMWFYPYGNLLIPQDIIPVIPRSPHPCSGHKSSHYQRIVR